MQDLLQLHRLGGEEFADRVGRVGATQWANPTPCEGWNVRHLVEHVVGFNLLVPWLLDGHRVEDVPPTGDLLGASPAATARQSVKEAQTAFERPGALAAVVHHPVGDIPASLFMVFRIFDLCVHGWDLAAATGFEFETDPRLLDAVLGQARDLEEAMAASGMFAPSLSFPPAADPLTEVLARTGRRAGWTSSEPTTDSPGV